MPRPNTTQTDDPLEPYPKRADGGYSRSRPLDQQWLPWALMSGIFTILMLQAPEAPYLDVFLFLGFGLTSANGVYWGFNQEIEKYREDLEVVS